MNTKETCEIETLAHNHSCAVGRCRHCGGVHLHVGPMTLRLNEDALLELSDTLAAAAFRLRTWRRDVPQGVGDKPQPADARRAKH